MRTTYQAKNAATAMAMVRARALAIRLRRSSRRVGPSSVCSGTSVATYQSSEVGTPARTPPMGAIEASVPPPPSPSA